MKNNFANDLREEILKRLDSSEGINSIDIQEVVKNNSTTLTGLVFKSDSNIAPIIYIEHAYEQYESGRPIEDIAESVINTYHESVNQCPVRAEDFLDYNRVKDKLVVSVLNTEANKEMLKDMPHQEIEDVSVIARIEVSNDETGVGMVKVNNQIFENYGITKEELISDAWANMKSMHPASCKDMIDVIKNMHPDMPESLAEIMEEKRGELFVVQTENGFNGGAYGFDKETLTSVCNQIDSQNIYILPSSVNEIIISPENKIDNPEGLSIVISQVNSENVPEDEFLSNNAYYFNSQTQELTTVNTDPAMTMKM